MLIRLLQIAALTAACVVPGVPPVGNVSTDPKGEAPPEVRLDEMEMKPDAVIPEHRASQTSDTVDWSVSILGAEKAWAKGWTGKGITFAVLDTGIDSDHKDISPNLLEAKDFTRSRTGTTDVVGHGTHCFGSIAAAGNGWGTKGVAFESKGYAGKVLGDNGSGRTDDIANGVKWAVEKGVHVISMSLGGPGTDPYMPEALKLAEEAGVIVIAANGNDNGGPVSYPAAYPTVVAISALDKNKKLASFSNVGKKTEAAGPGVQVRSTYPGNRFADMSGTSMATPNDAGVACVWSEWAEATKVPRKDRPAAFRKWLETGCEDLGDKGRDSKFGWGLPDLDKLPKKGDGVTPPPPPVDPKPGPGLLLDETDLNEKGLKKLKDAGLDKLRLELGGKGPVAPPAAPKITHEQLKAKVDAGEEPIVAIGVRLDTAKYPTGYEHAESAETLGVPPGVYRCRTKTIIDLEPLE